MDAKTNAICMDVDLCENWAHWHPDYSSPNSCIPFSVHIFFIVLFSDDKLKTNENNRTEADLIFKNCVMFFFTTVFYEKIGII